MKKILFYFLSVMLFFTFYAASSAQAKLTEQTVIKIITKDFADTHNINVDGYKYIPNKEFEPFKKDLAPARKALSDIFLKIHNEQIMGDFSPVFYIDEKNKKGYVLEKKLSGMNNLYILSYNSPTQKWNITDKINKKGTDVIDLGLIKGAK